LTEQVHSQEWAVKKLILAHPDKVKALTMLAGITEFNFYRMVYKDLSFADLKRLNTRWYTMFPDQGRFDSKFVKDCLREANVESVAELGGYQGELAFECLTVNPHLRWVSFDIIPHKTLPELRKYEFSEYVLQKQLWHSLIDLSGFQAFVSMHTLEHFSNTEFLELLDYLFKQKIRYLILQLPVKPEDHSWKHYFGSHLLTYGSNKIKQLLGKRYELVREVAKGERMEDGWCSFWRLKNGK